MVVEVFFLCDIEKEVSFFVFEKIKYCVILVKQS